MIPHKNRSGIRPAGAGSSLMKRPKRGSEEPAHEGDALARDLEEEEADEEDAIRAFVGLDDDPDEDEDIRASRAADLQGLSAYAVRAARALEEEDDENPLPLGSTYHGGPPVEEDLSVSPEDLGREFLKGAVQDPHPLEPDEPDIPDETVRPSAGERRMREDVPGSGRVKDELITDLPDGTDQEDAISKKALEEIHRHPRRHPSSR
jgi:hypothetical protein